MDIAAEIRAIELASSGQEVRQRIVAALEKLNRAVLPAVTAADAGKVLMVSSSGEWVADWCPCHGQVTPTEDGIMTEDGIVILTEAGLGILED